MLQGSGTVNFPAGEKLTAGSWKAAFSEIGRAEPYIYGAAVCDRWLSLARVCVGTVVCFGGRCV
jgi:hypothetical protein